MLATTSTAVKFRPTLTPEQPAAPRHRPVPHDLLDPRRTPPLAADQQQSRSTRSKRPSSVTSWRWDATCSRRSWPSPATGDAGPTLTVPGDGPDDPPRVLPRLDQPRRVPTCRSSARSRSRGSATVHDRLEAAPLDARLHLPRRQYSYLFQQWLGLFVVDDAHAEAIKKLQTILGLEVSVKASEDLNREQGSDVEPFQDHLPTPEATEEGPILVVTADCKGVPWWCRHCRRRRRRPTPRFRSWRTRAVARARRRTRRRWRRWVRSTRSTRSCAPPTR